MVCVPLDSVMVFVPADGVIAGVPLDGVMVCVLLELAFGVVVLPGLCWPDKKPGDASCRRQRFLEGSMLKICNGKFQLLQHTTVFAFLAGTV